MSDLFALLHTNSSTRVDLRMTISLNDLLGEDDDKISCNQRHDRVCSNVHDIGDNVYIVFNQTTAKRELMVTEADGMTDLKGQNITKDFHVLCEPKLVKMQ